MTPQKKRGNAFAINYGSIVEQEILRLQKIIEKDKTLTAEYDSRWLAMKLIEKDENVMNKLATCESCQDLIVSTQESIARLEERFSDGMDTLFADKRYGWINGLVREVVDKSNASRISVSDRIDSIVTNRILGIPIFLFLMWVVFKITTDVAAPFLDWVDGVIGGPITNWTTGILNLIGLSGTWIESLFVDGIIAGVGGVLVFVPVMLALYFALALLEDSGYMARAAFVMDRFMHGLGLHGKSFMCMIVGFGCTVPAVYATRTLENEKDRILTGLLVPFMSCGARLPVYVLFASIFFPSNSNAVIFSLYVGGIAVAALLGIILSRTIFKKRERSPFVLELPPYRMPTARNIWFLMWERTRSFVKKAFSFIMVTSVVIWLLLAIPVGDGAFADTDVDNSAFASVSRIFTPVLQPTGFASWQNAGSLITGFVAKEVVVSTMGQIFQVDASEEIGEATSFFQDVVGVVGSFFTTAWETVKSIPLVVGIDLFEGEEEEEPTQLMGVVQDHFEQVSGGHGALASVAFMAFVLLYTPCMVALAAQIQEFGIKWALFGAGMQLIIAYLFSVLIFQGGLLFSL